MVKYGFLACSSSGAYITRKHIFSAHQRAKLPGRVERRAFVGWTSGFWPGGAKGEKEKGRRSVFPFQGRKG